MKRQPITEKDPLTGKPFKTARACSMHGGSHEEEISQAENFLLGAYHDLRRADASEEGHREWEAWRYLRFLVDNMTDGGMPHHEEPENLAIGQAVTAWMRTFMKEEETQPEAETSPLESILTRLSGIIGEINALRDNHEFDNDGFNDEMVELFNSELPHILTHLSGSNAMEHGAEAFATGLYGKEIATESARTDFNLAARDGFILARVLMSCTLKQTSITDFLMLAGVAAERAKGGTTDAS
jgi:predicted secreted protein